MGMSSTNVHQAATCCFENLNLGNLILFRIPDLVLSIYYPVAVDRLTPSTFLDFRRERYHPQNVWIGYIDLPGGLLGNTHIFPTDRTFAEFAGVFFGRGDGLTTFTAETEDVGVKNLLGLLHMI
jgi:hypothetical protein